MIPTLLIARVRNSSILDEADYCAFLFDETEVQRLFKILAQMSNFQKLLEEKSAGDLDKIAIVRPVEVAWVSRKILRNVFPGLVKLENENEFNRVDTLHSRDCFNQLFARSAPGAATRMVWTPDSRSFLKVHFSFQPRNRQYEVISPAMTQGDLMGWCRPSTAAC